MGHVGAVRWASFLYHGEPESGEVRTMDDGGVWARIVGPDPKGDADRWVPLLDPDGNEAPGVSGVRFGDVTVAMSADTAPKFPDDMRAGCARTDFILDMYESGVYDGDEAGEKLFGLLFGPSLGTTWPEGRTDCPRAPL